MEKGGGLSLKIRAIHFEICGLVPIRLFLQKEYGILEFKRKFNCSKKRIVSGSFPVSSDSHSDIRVERACVI